MKPRLLCPTVALLPLLLTACASGNSSSGAASDRARNSRVITAEEIEASGVRTAWEALERMSHVSLSGTRTGRPARATMRGKSSILLDDSPIVVVDGIVSADFRVLDQIDAKRIRMIELLNGAEATTRFGTGSAGGAIVVITMSD